MVIIVPQPELTKPSMFLLMSSFPITIFNRPASAKEHGEIVEALSLSEFSALELMANVDDLRGMFDHLRGHLGKSP